MQRISMLQFELAASLALLSSNVARGMAERHIHRRQQV